MFVFQDGGLPYPGIKSNPDVIKMVCTQWHVHPQPDGCSARVYAELAKCWSFEPSQRPSFNVLANVFQGIVTDADADVASGLWPQPPAVLGSQHTAGDGAKARESDYNKYAFPTSSGASDASGYIQLQQSSVHSPAAGGDASKPYELGHPDAAAGGLARTSMLSIEENTVSTGDGDGDGDYAALDEGMVVDLQALAQARRSSARKSQVVQDEKELRRAGSFLQRDSFNKAEHVATSPRAAQGGDATSTDV